MGSYALDSEGRPVSVPATQCPYFRPAHQLPAPLPNKDQILAGERIPTNRDDFGGSHGHVITVGDSFVVKYGPNIRENEGHALLLLEQYPSIPSPKLYAMYYEAEVLYLVMERLPGENLRALWDELSEGEKVSICVQLKEAFVHIRSIPSPGIFGSVTGGCLEHLLFGIYVAGPDITGPFDTLEKLHLGLALNSKRQQQLNQRPGWHSDWLARHLPQALGNNPSTFTHADLAKQNIMVQEQAGASGQKERQFRLTGIVDWEFSGWYPKYWEYSNIFAQALWDDDWELKVDLWLDPCPSEAAMLRFVKVDIEGF